MNKVLQLNIAVRGIKPPIWRRFLIKDNLTFEGFHNVIQKIMGWENYHLYEFDIKGSKISPEEEGYNPAYTIEGAFSKLFESPEFMQMLKKQDIREGPTKGDIHYINALIKRRKRDPPKRRFTIKDIIGELITSEHQKFTYTYDFGDNWGHTLHVEKVMNAVDAPGSPVCLAGERACPPEDCGGTGGYSELIKIKKNKSHPEYKERILGWLGEEHNFEFFDKEKINERLKRFKGR